MAKSGFFEKMQEEGDFFFLLGLIVIGSVIGAIVMITFSYIFGLIQ